MKKIILLLPILLLFQLSNAQKWTPYKIDDSIQFALPKEFKKSDTLGQTMVTASTQFGTILVIKSPDNANKTPEIEKKKHLDNFYQEYLSKVKLSAEDASIIDEKDTTIKNLRYKEFTLQTDSGSGKQIRNFRILHVNDATYTFEFLYQDLHKEYAVAEKDKFFKSIQIPEATLTSQFTEAKNTTGTPPKGGNTGLIIGIIAGLVILIIIFLVFRRKQKQSS